jgi:hypothetical protein
MTLERENKKSGIKLPSLFKKLSSASTSSNFGTHYRCVNGVNIAITPPSGESLVKYRALGRLFKANRTAAKTDSTTK